jgi:drug/metabolite transporter (DMT)-like permease
MITVRSATHENNYALTFWPQITNGMISVLVMLWLGHITSTPIGIIFALCSGILGGLGVLLTNASLQVAPVAVVSPYHYTQIIGGALVGYLIWGHIPAWSTILGAMIITISGLYILHTEARKQPPDTQYLIE